MARKAFTEHPEFMTASGIANALLQTGVARMGCGRKCLNDFEAHANRIADDLTRLLLRAHDAELAKSKAA